MLDAVSSLPYKYTAPSPNKPTKLGSVFSPDHKSTFSISSQLYAETSLAFSGSLFVFLGKVRRHVWKQNCLRSPQAAAVPGPSEGSRQLRVSAVLSEGHQFPLLVVGLFVMAAWHLPRAYPLSPALPGWYPQSGRVLLRIQILPGCRINIQKHTSVSLGLFNPVTPMPKVKTLRWRS